MLKFHRLRGLGPIGNSIAVILTFLTTNWQVVVSVIAAVAAGSVDWLRAIVLNSTTIAAASTFFAALWTIIGITVLVDRRRPRVVRTHIDYRYGLTFEGIQPRYRSVNETIPDAGSLSFGFLLRNFSPSPIRYEVESIDIRLGTRALPRFLPGTLIGFMARGAGRSSTLRGFTKEQLAEFYNNSLEDPAKGTIDISIVYGAPEAAPERRLQMNLEFYAIFINNGESLGWQNSIVSERDEPWRRI